jgi:hypothetical protein
MARTAKQVAAQRKASLASARKRKAAAPFGVSKGGTPLTYVQAKKKKKRAQHNAKMAAHWHPDAVRERKEFSQWKKGLGK